MHWTIAVAQAQRVEDLSYEEWCQLYVNRKAPTSPQITQASKTAKEVLVRNGQMDPAVVIELGGHP